MGDGWHAKGPASHQIVAPRISSAEAFGGGVGSNRKMRRACLKERPTVGCCCENDWPIGRLATYLQFRYCMRISKFRFREMGIYELLSVLKWRCRDDWSKLSRLL